MRSSCSKLICSTQGAAANLFEEDKSRHRNSIPHKCYYHFTSQMFFPEIVSSEIISSEIVTSTLLL